MDSTGAEDSAFEGRELVLLGAGASVEAGVPAAMKATARLVSVFQEKRPWDAGTLHFVCGALIAYDAANGASPFEELDVERVVSAIRLLADRRSLEVSPFVWAWHPNVEELDLDYKEPTMALDALVDLLVPDPSIGAYLPSDRDPGWDISPQEVEEKRSRIRLLMPSVVQDKSSDGEGYSELLSAVIRELCSLMVVVPGSERYLLPLARAGRRPGGLTVATLNYDRALEQACGVEGVSVHTGIAEWDATRRWGWPQEGLRLLKLHGSIDWRWDPTPGGGGHMGQLRTIQADSVMDTGPPALIFGGREKLVAEGPFLSLLREFEAFLRDTDRLVIVGYSFRDAHVNEAIRHWTGQSATRTIAIIDPYWPETLAEDSFREELLSSLNAPDLPPRVEVRRETASAALQQLYG
jgi:SIR2-like domain